MVKSHKQQFSELYPEALISNIGLKCHAMPDVRNSFPDVNITQQLITHSSVKILKNETEV